MDLKEMITKRRSFRKYTNEPVEEELLACIMAFAKRAKPLLPGIGVHMKVVTKEQVRFMLPWKTPQLIAIYSEPKEGYLENAGFILQQIDLYIQSLGLGSCWLGLGKMRMANTPEGMEFVILLAFGHSEESLRGEAGEFKRLSLTEIADREDAALEPARLAPSSTNSQPWYFTHEGDRIHAYCSLKGLLRHKMLEYMNRIDMGIAFAHLYLTNPETFRFSVEEAPQLPGYRYTGTVKLQ